LTIICCGVLASFSLSVQSAERAPAVETPAAKAKQAAAWAEIHTWPNLWEGSWQGISPIIEEFATPPSYTPQAQKLIDAFKPVEDSTFANCHPQGMPFVMNIVAMPMKFFPSLDLIALYIEGFGTTRFIHMDGREHSKDPNPTYLGESIGHWEGDTLVVSTIGLLPDTTFQIGLKPLPKDLPKDSLLGTGSSANPVMKGIPVYGQHGPNVRFIERMHMKNFNTLEIQTTVYDDTVFTKPYAFPPRTWHRYLGQSAEPQEWYCTSNRDFFDPESGKLEYDVKGKAISR
jgi:hypothetical protein